METVYLREDFIKLGQALKASGLAESGVDAKYAVQNGLVKVNGQIEIRRGRKLKDGDVVSFGQKEIRMEREKRLTAEKEET